MPGSIKAILLLLAKLKKLKNFLRIKAYYLRKYLKLIPEC